MRGGGRERDVGRFLSGVGATVFLMAAGWFVWQSNAEEQTVIPPAPLARLAAAEPPPLLRQARLGALTAPPAATAKTREEKRFGRADKDDDGRITRAELLAPRQKAFAKLDKNSDGKLAFEEWAAKTIGKFDGADDNGDGALTATEYAETAPKTRPKKACSC